MGSAKRKRLIEDEGAIPIVDFYLSYDDVVASWRAAWAARIACKAGAYDTRYARLSEAVSSRTPQQATWRRQLG